MPQKYIDIFSTTLFAALYSPSAKKPVFGSILENLIQGTSKKMRWILLTSAAVGKNNYQEQYLKEETGFDQCLD